MKVWDIMGDKPEFVFEKAAKLGVLQVRYPSFSSTLLYSSSSDFYRTEFFSSLLPVHEIAVMIRKVFFLVKSNVLEIQGNYII